MLSIIMSLKLAYTKELAYEVLLECRVLENRVIEAMVAHNKGIEGSRANMFSSTTLQGERCCGRLQDSDFTPPLCNPGQIKPLVGGVSSSVKACLTRLLRGLNKLIHVNNEEPCVIHKKGSINEAMIRIE